MIFPHTDPIDVGWELGLGDDLRLSVAEIKEMLTPHLSEKRRQRIEEVVAGRTYTVVPVVEGLHDLGNIAAVLRSAEGMGFQGAHIIDTQPKKKTSKRITQGADKWLDIKRWKDTNRCLTGLKEKGYQICATHLEAAIPIEEVDFTRPTAIILGNELEGVSEAVLQAADLRCIIPMTGFVQSYNISVAAALSLYEALRQRVERLGGQGDLTAKERAILEAVFYMRAVTKPEIVIPELGKRWWGG